MNRKMAVRILTMLVLHALVFPALADIRLPRLVSDGMVLQRDEELVIWGWADPGEPITVTLASETGKTVTGPDGKWSTVLPAMDAGGPYTLTIKGKNQVVINDVLLGDVWFCSGQSNMVHMLDIHDVTYAQDIVEADFPQIRQFLVPTATDLMQPQPDVPAATWEQAIGEKVRAFSAVAYFFATQIHKTQGIPVGIINASVGGTPIEAWTSEAGLRQFPEVTSSILQNKDTAYVHATNRAAALANTPAPFNDMGITSDPKWFETDHMPGSGWRTINVPGYWEDQGIRNLNGIVWYRKEVEIPAAMVGKPARIFLGRIVDADELYINGKKIGNTTYMYPQRRYHIAADVLKAGTNVFVVRVTNHNGKGGFVPDKPYCIFAGADTVDLKGTWHYKVGAVFPPAIAHNRVPSINIQNQPTALFNAMVAPVTDYAIKGVLWYQGESNVAQPEVYAGYMRALIADWRNQWGDETLPFLFVQLPGFMEYNYLPAESHWAELREAQRQTLTVQHTAMAVAIDLGEWNDIHPERKKEVGERLARLAREMVYHEDINASGPLYRSYRKEGSKIRLSFDAVGSGLKTADGGPLAEFAVAGADKKFVWAQAEIVGDDVVVWCDSIPDPLYVRYAWADNPVNPNLYNKEGLPASPFGIDMNSTQQVQEARLREQIQKETQADYSNMLAQLGNPSLRPGPSGNPDAPNAANTDESKATPYRSLPDPLLLESGGNVTDASTWWNVRRPEIAEAFDREVYGRMPPNTPEVRWEVVRQADTTIGNQQAVTKQLVGRVDNSSYPQIEVNIQLSLTLPRQSDKPVPVIMEFGFQWPRGIGLPPVAGKSWQEQVLEKGYGYAILVPTSYQADNGAGLTAGIIGLMNKGQRRKPEDWGALKAWAWGASRAIDYLETDPSVDAEKVAIEGLSRYGKAAIVTMAYEPRIAAGFIGSSGAGGTKILRRVLGEQVENLASSGGYHWFAGNFIRYAGPLTVNDLPVDAHELVALCAPRPVFISSGAPDVEGQWVDARGMFLGGVHAGPVYRLLGKRDLGTAEFPPIEAALTTGEVAWRQHSGGHTTGPNWPTFLEWVGRYFDE